jgi:hypothetical protein
MIPIPRKLPPQSNRRFADAADINRAKQIELEYVCQQSEGVSKTSVIHTCILADASDINRAKQIELEYMSVDDLKE